MSRRVFVEPVVPGFDLGTLPCSTEEAGEPHNEKQSVVSRSSTAEHIRNRRRCKSTGTPTSTQASSRAYHPHPQSAVPRKRKSKRRGALPSVGRLRKKRYDDDDEVRGAPSIEETPDDVDEALSYLKKDQISQFYGPLSDQIDRQISQSFKVENSILDLQSMALSKYMVIFSQEEDVFAQCLADPCTNGFLASLVFAQNKWNFHLPTQEESYLTISSEVSGSFLIFIKDFLLAYDSATMTFFVRMPTAPEMHLKYSDMKNKNSFFNSLIGDTLAVQQVYFLARRLVLFIGATWENSCLADEEKKLSNTLRCSPNRGFSDVFIDLDPMSFDCISGIERVRYLSTEDENLHCIGVQMFGKVLGFVRTEVISHTLVF